MASDSTNLTDILSPAADIDHDVARRAADAAIAAGWRPPAPVIEHQAQLGGWPIGTVIRDARDGVARRTRTGDGPAWILVGAGSGRPVALPAVVLWEPEQEARR